MSRETEGLRSRMENRTNVIPRTFDQVSSILEELGYVEGEKLSNKGVSLTRIYAESDLLLTEMIYQDLFAATSPADLVGLLSGLIFEGRGERSKIPRIPKSLENSVKACISTWSKLVYLEENEGLNPQREPNFDLACLS